MTYLPLNRSRDLLPWNLAAPRALKFGLPSGWRRGHDALRTTCSAV